MHKEYKIEGARASVTVMPLRPSEDKIVGVVVNENSSENISKKWTIPIRDWKSVLNQFCIMFETRMPNL